MLAYHTHTCLSIPKNKGKRHDMKMKIPHTLHLNSSSKNKVVTHYLRPPNSKITAFFEDFNFGYFCGYLVMIFKSVRKKDTFVNDFSIFLQWILMVFKLFIILKKMGLSMILLDVFSDRFHFLFLKEKGWFCNEFLEKNRTQKFL